MNYTYYIRAVCNSITYVKVDYYIEAKKYLAALHALGLTDARIGVVRLTGR